MFEKELTPPPDGRLSSSSGSPDSVYKSSLDSSDRIITSSDGSSDSFFSQKTSTAYKQPISPMSIPKFKVDDESDIEWDSSFMSPPPKKPPTTMRKAQKFRSRIMFADSDAKSIAVPITAFNNNTDDSTNNNDKGVLNNDSYNLKTGRTPDLTRMKGNKENCFHPAPPSSPLATPPHKRMRALRIRDSIAFSVSPIPMSTRSPARSQRISPRGSLFSSGGKRSQKASPVHRRLSINPFTPSRNIKTLQRTRNRIQNNSDSGFDDDSWLLDVGKHDNSCDMDSEESFCQPDLDEISTCRYKEEFCEECVVGNGEFGMVFKCVNRLDGCTYAIKRSTVPVAGSTLERMSRNEVYAQAVLGKHSHVVRYYSAWAENGHLYIQTEFCNGGSLADEINTHIKRGTRFTETELKEMLRQTAHGLKYIHAQLLVHMDIKPGNIFIQYNPLITQTPESGFEDDNCSDSEITDEVTYKLGDFGHVVSIGTDRLEEGDCRFLPRELLNDDYKNLPRADIFALGLSLFQAATLTDLPKNGDKWHSLRGGNVPYMEGYSVPFNDLIRKMIHPQPLCRPSAASLASHPDLCPEALRSRQELARELNEERFKNQLLSEQLKAVQEHAEKRSNAIRPNTRASRMVGVKVNRSKSLTNF